MVAIDTYAALSLRYRVAASNAAVGAEFARLYQSCAASDLDDEPGPVVAVELCDEVNDRRVRVGESFALEARDRNELLLSVMTEIDAASVSASASNVVLLHASAVQAADGPVLLIGPSGAGKSTLSAALAARGWTYVGDEVVGLDESATQLLANPKPWKLDRRSRLALAEFGVGACEPTAADEEVLVAPLDVGAVHHAGPAGEPAAIVRVEFREDARAAVSNLSRADGAELLADQCFNFAQWGGRALDTVAALARRAPAFRLVFGDLPAAVAALDAALQ
jgi:hypothetical protein